MALSQFKHTLQRVDQLVFDELFANARRHLADAAYAAHPLNAGSFPHKTQNKEKSTVFGSY